MDEIQEKNRNILHEIVTYLHDNYIIIKCLKKANEIHKGCYSKALAPDVCSDFEQDIMTSILCMKKPERIIRAYLRGPKDLYRYVWGIIWRQNLLPSSRLNKYYLRHKTKELSINDLSEFKDDDTNCDGDAGDTI